MAGGLACCRSGEPLRHPKSNSKSSFSVICKADTGSNPVYRGDKSLCKPNAGRRRGLNLKDVMVLAPHPLQKSQKEWCALPARRARTPVAPPKNCLWNPTLSTLLRAGSNVEKRDIRMGGTWRFRAVKTLGKTLYSYLRHARYLKHADLELRFRDHVCSVLDHRVDIRCRYRDRY